MPLEGLGIEHLPSPWLHLCESPCTPVHSIALTTPCPLQCLLLTSASLPCPHLWLSPPAGHHCWRDLFRRELPGRFVEYPEGQPDGLYVHPLHFNAPSCLGLGRMTAYLAYQDSIHACGQLLRKQSTSSLLCDILGTCAPRPPHM